MIDSGYSATASKNVYTDLSSVHAIRSTGREDKSKALDEISKQFESMMVRMMLKSMRDANEVFAKDNFLSSHEGNTYQQMYDDQLALSLSAGRGMGIAEIMAKQLKGRFDDGDQMVNSVDSSLTRNMSIPSQVQPALQSVESRKSIQKSSVNFDGSIKDFVQKIYPMALAAASKLGVEPEALIAQSALETGWGTAINSNGNIGSSHNLFNIKADRRWGGDTYSIPTLEFRDGLPVKEHAAFRSYSSLKESFEDYVDFISNSPRYAQAKTHSDSEMFIKGLSDAGYATDPEYTDKVMRIVNSQVFKSAIANLQNESSSSNSYALSEL